MIRVQVPSAQLAAGLLRLGGDEHHYLMRVRRVRAGEAVELFDGAGNTASALITAIDASATTLEVSAVRRQLATSWHLTSLIPLLKGERMDQCIEKLVEVGCDRLVLWEAHRAVVRLPPDKLAARLERIRAQVAAAVRQCGRAELPEVAGVWTLDEVLAQTAAQRRLVLAQGAPRLVVGASLESEAAHVRPTVAMLSGPEGGLSPEELQRLDAAGFERASLTATILRAETAPVIAVALWRWSESP